MVQMTATAISFGIAAEVSLWVHMGIMIGLGVLALIGYIFLRSDFKEFLTSFGHVLAEKWWQEILLQKTWWSSTGCTRESVVIFTEKFSVFYWQIYPPSIGSKQPLINLESGPQRKATTPETSFIWGKPCVLNIGFVTARLASIFSDSINFRSDWPPAGHN